MICFAYFTIAATVWIATCYAVGREINKKSDPIKTKTIVYFVIAALALAPAIAWPLTIISICIEALTIKPKGEGDG